MFSALRQTLRGPVEKGQVASHPASPHLTKIEVKIRVGPDCLEVKVEGAE